VAAVVSGYLTFRALRWKGGSTESNVQVGVGSVKLSGTF
jgi:hypothetical protein